MDKATLCYSCLGCVKLEDYRFKGVTDCSSFRPDCRQNTFIDRIVKEWEQKKIKKNEE